MRWPAKHERLWKRAFAFWPVRIHGEWAWWEWYYVMLSYSPGDCGMSVSREWPHDLTDAQLLACDLGCGGPEPHHQ